jgi:hypothetical protein
LVIGEEQEDQREHQHAEDLGRDPDVVQDGDEPDPERIDDGRDDQRRDGDEREHVAHAQRRRGIEEPVLPNDAVDHERDDAGDGGHRHDLRPEVEPPREPAEGAVREALRPLVDGPGDRVMAGQLGEAEGDDELTGDDDQPGPEHHRAAQPDADAEVAERPGADADEAEGEREVRHEPEGPVQLRLDPERLQVGVIARRDVLGRFAWSRHGFSSSHRTDDVRADLWS